MKRNIFAIGLRDGIPIALGYLAVSFSFGIAAVAAGLTPIEAILISMTNLTSAGQFAGIGIITGFLYDKWCSMYRKKPSPSKSPEWKPGK